MKVTDVESRGGEAGERPLRERVLQRAFEAALVITSFVPALVVYVAPNWIESLAALFFLPGLLWMLGLATYWRVTPKEHREAWICWCAFIAASPAITGLLWWWGFSTTTL